MKMIKESGVMKNSEGGENHMMKEHRGPMRHMPPHERKALIRIEFDESDWSILREVFGDEDTVVAAAQVIREAPPEIQILAMQLMNLMREVPEYEC